MQQSIIRISIFLLFAIPLPFSCEESNEPCPECDPVKDYYLNRYLSNEVISQSDDINNVDTIFDVNSFYWVIKFSVIEQNSVSSFQLKNPFINHALAQCECEKSQLVEDLEIISLVSDAAFSDDLPAGSALKNNFRLSFPSYTINSMEDEVNAFVRMRNGPESGIPELHKLTLVLRSSLSQTEYTIESQRIYLI